MCTIHLARLVAAVTLSLPTLSLAAAVPPVELGARIGWATAFGDAARQVAMKEFTIASQLPLQLEVAVRLRPELSTGLYLSYGVGQVDRAAIFGACDVAGVSCSGHAWRAGAQARWTFAGLPLPLAPWAGAALGWEWTSVEGKDAVGSSTIAVNGWELGLQGGGDWRLSPRLAVGPYLQLGIGRYRSGEVKVGGTTVGSGSITDKAFHGWLGLGVAGRFDLR